MKCPLLLLALLGAAHAVPYFRLDQPAEHRVDMEAEPLPISDPEEPGRPGAVFTFQLPKIDLSELFRPLRVFAGVNVDHSPSVVAERFEPTCDQGKFDLTDDEFDIVMDCQKRFAGDDVELKECMLVKLPMADDALKAFLDREEFGVSSLSSSFNIALVNGQFTQKRSVEFRLCPRDEVNSIEAGEEMVPVQVIETDLIDAPPGGVFPVLTPEVAAPPSPPIFSMPPLQLPNFSDIFAEAFGPVFGRPPPAAAAAPAEAEDAETAPARPGLFASMLNPFATQLRPVAQSEGQQGFFSSLFPQIAGLLPERNDVDLDNCSSRKFNVSRSVFDVASRCQYADNYRECLTKDLSEDEGAKEFLEFAAAPDFTIVASSFASYLTSFNLHQANRQNEIDLRRCANIVTEEKATDTIPKQTAETPEPVPETPEPAAETPEPAAKSPEPLPVTFEPAPETFEPASETSAAAAKIPNLTTESPESVPEAPEAATEAPSKLASETEKAAVGYQAAEP